MKIRRQGVGVLMGITLVIAMSLAPANILVADLNASASPSRSMVDVQSAYGHLPISFEANQGQTASPVNYLARGKGYTLVLTPSEAVLALRQPSPYSSASLSPLLSPTSREGGNEGTILRLQLLGATHSSTLRGLDELPGKANYFIGNNPEKWRTNIPTFAKVTQPQVYPGIDVVYYGNQRQVEFDFIVAPGADPNVIRLKVDGADRLEIDDHGDLLLHVSSGNLQLQRPRIYQELDGVKTDLSGQYVITAAQEVSFHVGAYDASRPLVIDPTLVYSTFLGGIGDDVGLGIAVDVAKNAYVTGYTGSTDFPGAIPSFAGGGHDVFVAKLNPGGSALLYSTYIGGNSQEDGNAIAVDTQGNAYVTGYTSSGNFPISQSALQTTHGGLNNGGDIIDGFVAKLNAQGILVYSTYLGGFRADYGRGIAVDADGDAYVTGQTSSANFPTANPLQATINGGGDAFVVKLNAEGTGLHYSTYLGGSGIENARGIAVDATENAYITGQTDSTDFPTANPLQTAGGGAQVDGFVAKLNPAGSALVYSTYLGGGLQDEGHSIAVDAAGSAYVTGRTISGDFPTASPLQATFAGGEDVFVAKLNAAGNVLVYSTYLGGTGNESGSAIAVSPTGSAILTGVTNSTNFPTASPLQATLAGTIGASDVFVTALNPTGSALVYSTYLGGSVNDYGTAIAIDSVGSAYLTGAAGSTDFPTANPLQATGGADAFVAKFGDTSTNQSPVCSAAQANPASLWSPNGEFAPIVVQGVTDPESDSVTIAITTVTQDEPVKGKSDKTSPDAVIQAGSASVRAERLSSGNGRVYQLSFSADDGKGGSCTGAVKVGVPLSLKKGLAAIDDGQLYDSTIP